MPPRGCLLLDKDVLWLVAWEEWEGEGTSCWDLICRHCHVESIETFSGGTLPVIWEIQACFSGLCNGLETWTKQHWMQRMWTDSYSIGLQLVIVFTPLLFPHVLGTTMQARVYTLGTTSREGIYFMPCHIYLCSFGSCSGFCWWSVQCSRPGDVSGNVPV